jgi:hypothetical protein
VSDDVYQPSGRVSWPRLIFFAVIALPVIALLSDLAFRLDKAQYYPPFLGAAAIGTLAAILASGVVEWGKCRNVKLGRALGVLFTLLFFFGFFQRSLIDARTRGSPEGLKGVPVSELVAGLPNYIALRMRNFEVAPNAVQPADAHQFLVVLRWGVFVMELAALVAVGWWFGGNAARRPFSEHSNVWMTGRRFALPSGMGEGLQAWLDGSSPLPERPKEGELTDVILLERDPKSPEDGGYLTLLAGSGRSRRFLARRRRVPAERFGELKAFVDR